MYWAEELANQTNDIALKEEFSPIAKQLADNEAAILNELTEIQGNPVNIGGYYEPNETLINEAMRPSKTLCSIL